MTCPICKDNSAHITETQFTDFVNCPRCGKFKIGRIASNTLQHTDITNRWKISAWVLENNPPLFANYLFETILEAPIPTLEHRAERMLRHFFSQYPTGRTCHSLGDIPALQSFGWNRDLLEVRYMLSEVLCDELGLLTRKGEHGYQVSPKGLLYLEGRRESISSIGFCAMWFSDEVLPLWTEVIAPAITAAGYEALRIDSKQHNGKIDDEIMASIRASKFVVSDFTGSRGGVYYEAGFAHGLGLSVIFMCRENDLKDIHFDVRQYNCILWTPVKLEETQSQLKNRILATLGQGPKLVQ